MKLFASLYDRVIAWAAHPHAERYLGALSFAESSFFPIPPDVMLAPMCLARPTRAFWLAGLTTLTSVLGGLAGYTIGFVAFDAIAPLIESAGYGERYTTLQLWFQEYGAATVLLAGFSPIPYKLFTISAGALAMNLPVFVLMSVIGRGARFYLVAGLLRFGGPRYEATLRRHIDTIGWLSVAVVLVGIGLWAAFHGEP
ncbi:MAG: YqaA family protein [Pseudomonadota bacterium]